AGAEYTFEVSKKWKGSPSKLIRISELLNSCSIGYDMGRGEWLVSAYHKKWLMPVAEKEYNKPFLQSDGCDLNQYYYHPDSLEADIIKLDKIFPEEIQLANTMNLLKIAFLFGAAASLLSIFLYLKLKI
ncbi:MAG: hypothetical protein AAFO82_21160, partial [Bacteroidota bacterium]